MGGKAALAGGLKTRRAVSVSHTSSLAARQKLCGSSVEGKPIGQSERPPLARWRFRPLGSPIDLSLSLSLSPPSFRFPPRFARLAKAPTTSVFGFLPDSSLPSFRSRSPGYHGCPTIPCSRRLLLGAVNEEHAGLAGGAGKRRVPCLRCDHAVIESQGQALFTTAPPRRFTRPRGKPDA